MDREKKTNSEFIEILTSFLLNELRTDRMNSKILYYELCTTYPSITYLDGSRKSYNVLGNEEIDIKGNLILFSLYLREIFSIFIL